MIEKKQNPPSAQAADDDAAGWDALWDEPCQPSHACTKSELALRYLPHVTPAAARRTLRQWISKNVGLRLALDRTGYTDKSILLTPGQIWLHYRYLGPP